MEEKLTIKQVLIITQNILRSIGSVPLEESEHIGVPISNAIRNLSACIDAINENEAREAEEKEAADGNADTE
jgi:hypothetical protein